MFYVRVEIIKGRNNKMNTKQPLISVFLPYYNDEAFLAQSIKSVLEQTYSNFELILFNHASKDSSKNIAHSFNDKRIVHIDSEINYGAGAGINLWKNLSSFKGDFIKVFCADDIMLPCHLEELQQPFHENTNIDIVFSPMINSINKQGKIINRDKNTIPFKLTQKDITKELLKSFFNSFSPLPWGNALIKKEALNSIYKDNSLIYLFDMSFWVSLLINNKKFYMINKTISSYRTSESSMMAQNSKHIIQACYFEHLVYCDLFYKIQDVQLAKYICDHVPTSIKEKFKPDDTSLIPFLIALEYANKPCLAYPRRPIMNLVYLNSMYQKIYCLLQNEEIRKELAKRFNFTIKDFRNLYTQKQNDYLFYKRHKLTCFISKLVNKIFK